MTEIDIKKACKAADASPSMKRKVRHAMRHIGSVYVPLHSAYSYGIMLQLTRIPLRRVWKYFLLLHATETNHFIL